ncbi:hydrogenase maturation nickel metallochaperone HypA [Mobiluncus sp.]|uniref:hydrogenase maturation nickel metallochaperone HypA n=1 Tax=Mobiluncus sp. TaxID=47293 RepID=UPI0027D99ADC|nr:hydrogenase/urease maturation nickel metallochaperone HypA [Mobiluncus sp.]MDY6077495.1 hydrogenase maturation nickel metallochaperone HypA [Mobiluncus sp.]
MHEVALSQQLARVVARGAAGREVLSVQVEVGHLRQVVPEALRFAWSAVRKSTLRGPAELHITEIPAVVVCRECQAKTQLGEYLDFRCGQCSSREVQTISGEEFRVVSIDVTPERNH